MSLDKETRELIEKLLLRGDRMLGETCPVCGTPLILIKSLGLRFCPKCKRYVIKSEEEYRKALSLGIKPGDMIIVGFRPKEYQEEPKIERKAVAARPKRLSDPLRELVEILIDYVRRDELEKALTLASIIKTLCDCLKE